MVCAEANEPADPSLDEFQRRVLGVLMEKAMAQPDYYPMTPNAIVAACNQKTSRHPVMDVDEDTVMATLDELRRRGLVTQVAPSPTARIKRYRHEADRCFSLQPRERALLAELLLRGPQTAGELRTRCSRFMPFDDLDEIALVLDCLAGHVPPLAAPLPREPGRSAIRHTHLLYPDQERPDTAADAETAVSSSWQTPSPATPATPETVAAGSTGRDTSSADVANLHARIDTLQEKMAELHQAVAEIRRRLDAFV